MKKEILEHIENLNLPQLKQGFETLSTEQCREFLVQLRKYPLDLLTQQRHFLTHPTSPIAATAPWQNAHFSGSLEDRQRGEELLSQGKAACLILAGGQGSRLNQGPKGFIPATAIKKKSLLQFFCERVRAASQRYGQKLPLCIMTSPLNHTEIEAFLNARRFFGLAIDQVILFEQSTLPFVEDSGNWLLEKPGKLAEGPAGNGEALERMHTLGILKEWQDKGIDSLNAIFIDNPLADPFDAELIGFHHRLQLEVTAKAVQRISAEEKMGVLADIDGRLHILEYSELPANAPSFPYLNTGLFCFSIPWVQHLYDTLKVTLPWHLARKTMGTTAIWKYEKFLFDLLALSKRTGALIYPREESYAPLKNATGDKSLETVSQALLHFDRKVFEGLSGKKLDVGTFELDPVFYYPDEALKKKWKGQSLKEGGYVIP